MSASKMFRTEDNHAQSYPYLTTAFTAPHLLPVSKNTTDLRQSNSAVAVDKAQESQEEATGSQRDGIMVKNQQNGVANGM